KQRQLEPGLAVHGAVTIRVRAARLGEDGNDIVYKAGPFRSSQRRQHRNQQQHGKARRPHWTSSAEPLPPRNVMRGESPGPAFNWKLPGLIRPVAVIRNST